MVNDSLINVVNLYLIDFIILYEQGSNSRNSLMESMTFVGFQFELCQLVYVHIYYMLMLTTVNCLHTEWDHILSVIKWVLVQLLILSLNDCVQFTA